jgi:hypothetical protein
MKKFDTAIQYRLSLEAFLGHSQMIHSSSLTFSMSLAGRPISGLSSYDQLIEKYKCDVLTSPKDVLKCITVSERCSDPFSSSTPGRPRAVLVRF